MRTGLKLLCVTLLTGTCALTGQARSADMLDVNISDMITLTLTQANKQNDACKASRRSVSNQCGQSYIYPLMSNHPDGDVAAKINSYIETLETKQRRGILRTESWTEVTLNKGNILSLSYTGQLYGHASEADQTIKRCSNLDLASGEPIDLSDVLKPGHLRSLPHFILTNLDTTLKHKLPAYMQRLLKNKNQSWTLQTNQAFHITEQDLVLCYDQNALSAEAVGPTTIAVPLDLISGMINETGLLSFVLENEVETNAPPNVQQPKPVAPVSTPSEFGNRIGSVDYTCNRDNIVHKISVVEHDDDSPFICIVEYDKQTEQKILWRSRKTKSFCHNNAEKLVSKYENKWGYTCGQTSNSPES